MVGDGEDCRPHVLPHIIPSVYSESHWGLFGVWDLKVRIFSRTRTADDQRSFSSNAQLSSLKRLNHVVVVI